MTTDPSSAETTEPPQETIPIPPRYWWLKRIMIGVGVTFLTLLVLRLWWGSVAQARYQAEIERLIATGEPIFPEDFNPKQPIPDELNGAKLYQEAGRLVSLTADEQELVNDISHTSNLSNDQQAELQRIVDAHSKVFALVRLARELPHVDWGTRFQTPVFSAFMRMSYSDHRLLSKLLSDRALYLHSLGDDAEVVETWLDAITQAQAVTEDPWLTSQLVGTAMFAVTYRRIEDITHTLRVYRVDSVNYNRQDATVAGVRVLIRRLLDERQVRETATRSARFERMLVLDITRIALKHRLTYYQAASVMGPVKIPWWQRARAWPMAPIEELDSIRVLRHCSEIVVVSAESTWPDAEKVLTPIDDDKALLHRFVRPISTITQGMPQRSLFLHFRLLAFRRMAATALAIRLYELDHGRRPDTLDELVPDYLPSVPLDLMAKGDTPIGYLPHAERPILYSVDKNGIDDGGRYVMNADGSINRRKYDWPFFLDGPPVPTPDPDQNANGSE